MKKLTFEIENIAKSVGEIMNNDDMNNDMNNDIVSMTNDVVTLRDFQLEGVRRMCENDDNYGIGSILAYDMGLGKCHKIDTPILMYNGNIKMVQDIEVGELLMGEDSYPRQVLSLGRGRDVMHKITNKSKESHIVNSEHILSLYYSGMNRVKKMTNTQTFEVKWFDDITRSIHVKYFSFMNKNEQDVIKKLCRLNKIPRH